MSHVNAATVLATRPARNAVKRRLLRQIGQQYRPGDRLPSVRELARMLDVAQNTAHEALRELATEGVLELRPRRGAFVALPTTAPLPTDHLDNSSAKRDRVRVAAYLHLRDRFVVDMYEGFEAKARTSDMSIGLSISPDTVIHLPEEWDVAVLFNPDTRTLVHCRPDQMVMLVTTAEENIRMQTARYDAVSVDQHQGGEAAGRALRDAGCRHIMLVGVASGPAHDPSAVLRSTCAKRFAGVEQGFGQPVPLSHRSYQEAYGVPPGGLAVDDFLRCSPRPDGVFCASDELALGFTARAMVLGLRPGADFKLVGFDGQQRSDDLLGFPIATVRVPSRDMGRRAAEMLIDRLSQPDQPPRRLMLGCTLRRGQTLGDPLAAMSSMLSVPGQGAVP